MNAKNINMEFCNYHKKRAKHLNNTVVTVESKEWKITLKQIQILYNSKQKYQKTKQNPYSRQVNFNTNGRISGFV